ncbi:unnamed protein product [Penicillium viridicatum]
MDHPVEVARLGPGRAPAESSVTVAQLRIRTGPDPCLPVISMTLECTDTLMVIMDKDQRIDIIGAGAALTLKEEGYKSSHHPGLISASGSRRI